MTEMDNVEMQEQLRKIRKACDLGPLTLQNMQDYWVDTASARDPMQHVRAQIKQELEHDSHRHILLYGHRGCGKSTELNQLENELGDDFPMVRINIQEELNPYDATAVKIVFIIAAKLAEFAEEKNLELDETALTQVYDFVQTVTTTTETSGRDAAAEVGAGIDTEASLLGKVVGLFVKGKANIKYASSSETERVTKLHERPGDLIATANTLIGSIRNAQPKIVVVVENIDKMDMDRFRTIFFENPSVLTALEINTIFTIPVFAVYSPDANRLKANFDLLVSMPMIKPTHPDGTAFEPGRSILKEIIARRISKNFFDDNLADQLVDASGGVIRLIIEVIRICVSVTDAKLPITKDTLNYAIKRKQSDFARQIVPPRDAPEGLDTTALYDRLEQLAKQQSKGKKIQAAGDTIDQILLQSEALCEYNGARWFGVHPLVRNILVDLGRAERNDDI